MKVIVINLLLMKYAQLQSRFLVDGMLPMLSKTSIYQQIPDCTD